MRIEYSDVEQSRRAFWSGLVLGFGGAFSTAVAAPLLAGDEAMRLGLVIVFFTCLSTATWSFTTPFREYLRKAWRWRYSEAGSAILYCGSVCLAPLARGGGAGLDLYLGSRRRFPLGHLVLGDRKSA